MDASQIQISKAQNLINHCSSTQIHFSELEFHFVFFFLIYGPKTLHIHVTSLQHAYSHSLI